MTLFLYDLWGVLDVGCLGAEATVQHCCCLSLTEVDADRRFIHAIYFFDPGVKLVDLVAVQVMMETEAVIGLSRGRYLILEVAPLEYWRLMSY